MRDIYLLNYSVQGIKTLDELVTLSFYKKTITKDFDLKSYNVKGIYGMNGSGKSGIVTSVDILRSILINPNYLNNPMVQKNLGEIINKKMQELYIEVLFALKFSDKLATFNYTLRLSKDVTGKYVISYEKLSAKLPIGKRNSTDTVFEVRDGEIVSIFEKDNKCLANMIKQKTTNLLATASMSALFFEKILISEENIRNENKNNGFYSLLVLLFFGRNLYVYMDQSDDHRDYFIKHSLGNIDSFESDNALLDSLIKYSIDMDVEILNVVSVTGNVVPKNVYSHFESTVENLYEFLRIFKSDLKGIEIDRKEEKDNFICSLIMIYDSYRIDAEFESTGIKKLIKLFAYLRELVRGGIVFIDEFDSNLHDVYLCALLEYLMEYADGQLCFTTHNVGPMDILKQHKNSIDFLSEDHKIYSWKASGNYSPSNLYRNGMIQGSPFNVDSIDFINVFSSDEEGV